MMDVHARDCLRVSVAFFFFFQAEDGIRDTSVTGVETCALPISDDAPPHLAVPDSPSTARYSSSEGADDPSGVPLPAPCPRQRSEERRVGKECRSRWARYH